jgi:hypothetical protein
VAEVLLRRAGPGDRPFILDSAWRSICEHPAAEDVAPAQIGELLVPLLDRWTAMVASPADTPDAILGWLCYRDPSTVAWGFTKPWARCKGVMAALAAHAGIGYSFSVVFPVATRLRTMAPRWRPYLVLGAP